MFLRVLDQVNDKYQLNIVQLVSIKESELVMTQVTKISFKKLKIIIISNVTPKLFF